MRVSWNIPYKFPIYKTSDAFTWTRLFFGHLSETALRERRGRKVSKRVIHRQSRVFPIRCVWCWPISIFQSILNKARSTISFYSRSITRKCIVVMRLEQISIIDWNHLRLSNNVIDFNLIRLHKYSFCCSSPIYLWENNPYIFVVHSILDTHLF